MNAGRKRANTLLFGFIGLLGLALYPIVVDPMINTEKYSKFRDKPQKLLVRNAKNLMKILLFRKNPEQEQSWS